MARELVHEHLGDGAVAHTDAPVTVPIERMMRHGSSLLTQLEYMRFTSRTAGNPRTQASRAPTALCDFPLEAYVTQS